MKIVVLDKDNITGYTDHLTADLTERTLRPFSHGLVVEDGDVAVASLLWEQKNIIQKAPMESLIFHFRGGDDKANELLFSEYKKHMADEDVSLSKVRIYARDHADEKKALKKAGFKVSLGEDDIVTTRLSVLRAMPVLALKKRLKSIHPLLDMTDIGYNRMIREMLFKNLFGLCEDLAFLPRDFFDNEVSCYYEEDGEVRGVMLIHRSAGNNLRPELMTAWGTDYAKIMPQLISHTLEFAGDIYDPGDTVIIDRHNIHSLALIEKLMPQKIGHPIFIGERPEKHE